MALEVKNFVMREKGFLKAFLFIQLFIYLFIYLYTRAYARGCLMIVPLFLSI